MNSISEEDAARFWERVDRSGGPDACWFLVTRRLGQRIFSLYVPAPMKIGTKQYQAHQIAYQITYGDLPSGMVIRHRCAYGGCCNPAHLRPGTPRENRLDETVRKRLGIPPGVLFTYEDEVQP